ncbi:MAG: hypothetical protein R3E96_07710 [Planctomycetota bacterium]
MLRFAIVGPLACLPWAGQPDPGGPGRRSSTTPMTGCPMRSALWPTMCASRPAGSRNCRAEQAQELADQLEVALVAFDHMAPSSTQTRRLRLSLLDGIVVPERFGSLFARLAWLSDAETERLHPLVEWQVVGPFDNERGRGMVRSGPAEKDPVAGPYKGKVRDVDWRELPAIAPRGGFIQISTLMDPDTQIFGLARTWIQSETARTVHLAIGASEELRVWLDGVAIYDALGEHAFGSMRTRCLTAGPRLAGTNWR